MLNFVTFQYEKIVRTMFRSVLPIGALTILSMRLSSYKTE